MQTILPSLHCQPDCVSFLKNISIDLEHWSGADILAALSNAQLESVHKIIGWHFKNDDAERKYKNR